MLLLALFLLKKIQQEEEQPVYFCGTQAEHYTLETQGHQFAQPQTFITLEDLAAFVLRSEYHQVVDAAALQRAANSTAETLLGSKITSTFVWNFHEAIRLAAKNEGNGTQHVPVVLGGSAELMLAQYAASPSAYFAPSAMRYKDLKLPGGVVQCDVQGSIHLYNTKAVISVGEVKRSGSGYGEGIKQLKEYIAVLEMGSEMHTAKGHKLCHSRTLVHATWDHQRAANPG
ncbi:hypothetical protein WJX77_000203 [Trebouxia sp. C0004]